MNLKEIVERATEIKGGQKELAIHLGLTRQQISDAKNGRIGLPIVACGLLADLLKIDHWQVVVASELATQKDERKREYLLPFVRHAACLALCVVGMIVTLFVTTTPAEANESMTYAGVVMPVYKLCEYKI